MLDEKYSNPAWWPIWANEKALQTASQVDADGRGISITNWERQDRRFEVAAGPAVDARVATFYYPLWRATLNGQSVGINKDENGAITIPLSAEQTNVHLYFQEPRVNGVALWISILTWVILGVLLFLGRFWSYRQKQVT